MVSETMKRGSFGKGEFDKKSTVKEMQQLIFCGRGCSENVPRFLFKKGDYRKNQLSGIPGQLQVMVNLFNM